MAKKKILKGEFYTPKVWVEKADEYISSVFGEKWKDETLVWDCSVGQGNLTKFFSFKDLIASTLESEDIQLLKDKNINPGSIKFQYDFLNKSLDDLPDEVKKKLTERGEILFLINPPYGKGKGKIDNTKGIAKTELNQRMVTEGYGRASSQLYCQFLYQIIQIQKKFNIKAKVAVFCPPLFMSANSSKNFRDMYYDNFNFKGGFLVNSRTFESREDWGLAFTIWEPGENQSRDINLEVFDIKDGEVVNIGHKLIYHITKETSGGVWVKQEAKKKKNTDYPRVKNPITIVNDGKKGKGCEDFLGFFHVHGNEVLYNESLVGLYSASYFFTIAGIQIIPENFEKVCSFFMARKSIDRNWIDEKDEYMKPSEDHPDYERWVNNSLIYACFNNSSNQSSLRNVQYNGKNWDIPNHFFWMSRKTMLELASTYLYPELLEDVENSSNRYLYNIILSKQGEFDEEFVNIHEMISSLVIKSFPKRREFSKDNPQYHLDSWDASYAQLKPFWKQEFPDEFREIKKAYRDISISLKEKVYELEFLRR